MACTCLIGYLLIEGWMHYTNHTFSSLLYDTHKQLPQLIFLKRGFFLFLFFWVTKFWGAGINLCLIAPQIVPRSCSKSPSLLSAKCIGHSSCLYVFLVQLYVLKLMQCSLHYVSQIMQSIGFLGPAFFLTQLSHVDSPAMAVLCMACSQVCTIYSSELTVFAFLARGIVKV